MIARIWRGAIRPENGDVQVAYVEEAGIRQYRQTPENISAHILRRDLTGRTKIVVLTFWQSMDAITGFASDKPEVAVYYPEDDRDLIKRPKYVEHYQVPASMSEAFSGDGG